MGRNGSFATRVSQLKIWHFCVIGIERNRLQMHFFFNRYSFMVGKHYFQQRPIGK